MQMTSENYGAQKDDRKLGNKKCECWIDAEVLTDEQKDRCVKMSLELSELVTIRIF